jgi:Uma2 family endonuclease
MMVAVVRGPHVEVSDDDLLRISEENPGWKIERADDGGLLLSPTSTPGGAKSAEALGQLYMYAKRVGGKAYDAATGFKTPAGGVLSPDASWLSVEHVAAHRDDKGFWPIMPDIVVEVASPSDAWATVTKKIDKYIADGAGYAIAIDPSTRDVYERGTRPSDFALDITAIIEA